MIRKLALILTLLTLSGCAATVPLTQYRELQMRAVATQDSLQVELLQCRDYAVHLENLYDKLEAEATIELRSQRQANSQLMAEVQRLNKLLDESKAKLIPSASDWANRPVPYYYTVEKNDCLWNISGKQIIYGNPWMWTRIYEANRDKIKNPDLIYPAQVFLIPRPANQ